MKIDFSFVGPPRFRKAVFPELSTVRLKTDRLVDGMLLPAGSQGAVVFIYRDGEAYEVEFIEPVAAVLTLTAAELAQ